MSDTNTTDHDLDIPTDLIWTTAPRNQGQIVEIQEAESGGVTYMRSIDHSAPVGTPPLYWIA